jgi:Tfp pilus assembly protein PilZ
MAESGSDRRRATRVVPPEPVTVAMENDKGSVAYGIVTNISETGACVRSDIPFTVGEELLLRLSFAREAQPLSATGRVVWQGGNGKSAGAVRHGLQWTYDGPHRVRLRLLVKAMIGQPSASS